MFEVSAHFLNSAELAQKSAFVSTSVFVGYAGNVTWLVCAILQSACHINVRYYPFDVQVGADSEIIRRRLIEKFLTFREVSAMQHDVLIVDARYQGDDPFRR